MSFALIKSAHNKETYDLQVLMSLLLWQIVLISSPNKSEEIDSNASLNHLIHQVLIKHDCKEDGKHPVLTDKFRNILLLVYNGPQYFKEIMINL